MTGTAVSNRNLWLQSFHRASAPVARLLCLPHAGGSASYYYPVSAALSPAVEVLAVQYPGRQDRHREPLIEEIEQLADGVVAACSTFDRTPLVLFGHSMGATVAFEVTRRLIAAGGPPPIRLFVSGRRAPSRWRDEDVHTRSDEGIIAELNRLSGTDSSMLGDEEVLRMILPVVRSDYRAIETYRGEGAGSVPVPITVLVGDADPLTTVDEAADWAAHTTAGFDLQVFPGGHFYLAERPAEVLAAIRAGLPAD
jgi:surfactin synthase thioesterase subunit